MADSAETKPTEASAPPPSTASTSASKPVPIEDDSDPDFDDLDDVLDQFSANAPSQPKPIPAETLSQPVPTASGPGRPPATASASADENESLMPSGQKPNESESEFIERLSKEMSAVFNNLATDPSKSGQSPEDIARMGKELEEFTAKMEQEGIKPEDLLKAILGEEEGAKIAELAQTERENLDKRTTEPAASTSSRPPPQPSTAPASSSTAKSKAQPKSFEDTIRGTMSLLGESDKSATSAVQQSTQKSEEDLLADMLRALEAGPSGEGAGAGGDDNLSKMFMDMMQQLTHKDLLYEPMKELHTQYPAWLAANQSKLPKDEFERYTRQSVIVADITKKFEEPGFNDDDPKCREFVWEKMQRMQDEGAPPEELVKNPFPGTDFGGIPGMGSGGGAEGLPEELGKELEEGCPTQ